jgi:hypothetical protein
MRGSTLYFLEAKPLERHTV